VGKVRTSDEGSVISEWADKITERIHLRIGSVGRIYHLVGKK
jgi:hypothetical protein